LVIGNLDDCIGAHWYFLLTVPKANRLKNTRLCRCGRSETPLRESRPSLHLPGRLWLRDSAVQMKSPLLPVDWPWAKPCASAENAKHVATMLAADRLFRMVRCIVMTSSRSWTDLARDRPMLIDRSHKSLAYCDGRVAHAAAAVQGGRALRQTHCESHCPPLSRNPLAHWLTRLFFEVSLLIRASALDQSKRRRWMTTLPGRNRVSPRSRMRGASPCKRQMMSIEWVSCIPGWRV
jgi:hypothetical protein